MSSEDVHAIYSRARLILRDLESGRGCPAALLQMLVSHLKQLQNLGQSPDAMSASLGLWINDVCGWLGIDAQQQRPTAWLILLGDALQ
ncbi:hypothetical protein JT358_10610 [Micrococcales bacterium 31B]|nr:hypothetical protein [Micrococcales bacterium 31B]